MSVVASAVALGENKGVLNVLHKSSSVLQTVLKLKDSVVKDSYIQGDLNKSKARSLDVTDDVTMEIKTGSTGDPKMVRTGFKKICSIKNKDCLICSEGFPSAALGISWMEEGRHLYVYQVVTDGLVNDVLPSYVTGINRLQAIDKIEGNSTITIITGSMNFVDLLVNEVDRFPLVNTLIVIPYNRFRRGELRRTGLRWTKLTHASVGGVTTSAWSLGIPKRFDAIKFRNLSPSSGLTRSLKHVIKDGESGKIIPAPSSNSLSKLVTLEEIRSQSFALPCYKSCTGWVFRKLSAFEKGMILDFNELVLEKVIQLGGDMETVDKLILSSVPGKITQLLHHAIIEVWDPPLKVEDGNSIPPSIRSPLSPSLLNNSKPGNLLLIEPTPLAIKASNKKDKLFLDREAAYLDEYGQKAVKSDDASVPVELWDRCVLRFHFDWLDYTPTVARALLTIRNRFAMRLYLRNLTRSFLRYLKSMHGATWWNKVNQKSLDATQLKCDLEVGVDSLVRCINSSWWEWSDGSTCHFWRWPEEVQPFIRDGFPVFIERKLPEYKMKQTFRGLNADQLVALENKIHKVIGRRYLNDGYVKSLINYFAVPKGLSDIRVVYDGTKSGLTDAVWAPNFFMPSIDSLLLYCSPTTWYSDLDLGEMFLNYFMDPLLRPFCGVDVSKFVSGTGDSSGKWLQWNRIFMGFRSSPYHAVKTYNWCLDLVRGNPDDASNPFAFDRVRLNLPGRKDYNPTLPWLTKMFGNVVASEITVYMDDGRPQGDSEVGCRRAGKRTSKITQHLGQQDAARKYRPPSQQPGPWCGAFIAERNGSVWAYVSDEKWTKAKSYITTWLKEIAACKLHCTPPVLDFKHLERGRGFLVYLSRTYSSMVPYLKGIHLTLDSWRPGRDKEGWKERKVTNSTDSDMFDEVDEEEVFATLDKEGDIKSGCNLYENHPNKVSLAPRLYDDLEALALFFKPDKPSWRFVRGSEIVVAEYGFGDASGAGFGSSFESQRGGINYRLGVWGEDVGGESSNFRELSNLVDALYHRSASKSEQVKGTEVFLFTDNAVAEGAFYKGTSSSKKLFNLVLKLRLLEMQSGMKIHIIHIAGTRMIGQGTDGLSRGDANEGVMQGRSMLDFVPLSQSCLDRSPQLEEKIRWCLSSYLKVVKQKVHFLRVKDWFLRGHDVCGGSYNSEGIWIPKYETAVYVWTPAPVLGQHAVEQLRQARLKRTSSTHLFILPRIFTSIWRKQLYKVSDLIVELPFDNQYWNSSLQHEPLTFACVFPFVSFKPWQLKRTYSFLGMGRVLRRMWKESDLSTWNILREFLSWAGRIHTLPEGMVRKMLQSASSFKVSYRETRE